MVIIYDIDTKEIIRTEDNTNVPLLPANMTLEERKSYFKENNQGYIVIENEIGANIYIHDLIFDEDGNFVNLQMKEGILDG